MALSCMTYSTEPPLPTESDLFTEKKVQYRHR
jgi:hypothetical protein